MLDFRWDFLMDIFPLLYNINFILITYEFIALFDNIQLMAYRLTNKYGIPLTLIVCLFAVILGCTTTKTPNVKTPVYDTSTTSDKALNSNFKKSTTSVAFFSFDDHFGIWNTPWDPTLFAPNAMDSLTQAGNIQGRSEKPSKNLYNNPSEKTYSLEIQSAVSDRIVENYLNAKNKEPGGNCLSVSKKRFEKAYQDVHGHSLYKDLPDSIATAYYTPGEVFAQLYVSASGSHEGWRSLPLKYRGKGSAGAIAYAGMGTLVDWFGIWNGKLKPGAPMQVWKHKTDYEMVVRGLNTKKNDPFGHSFIFIGYVRNDKNEIIGLRIADQGYQSYRPLIPNDYEVWWAVNLNV